MQVCPTYLLNTSWEFVALVWYTEIILISRQQHWTVKFQTWSVRCYSSWNVSSSPLWSIPCNDAFSTRTFCCCKTQPALSLFPQPTFPTLPFLLVLCNLKGSRGLIHLGNTIKKWPELLATVVCGILSTPSIPISFFYILNNIIIIIIAVVNSPVNSCFSQVKILVHN